MGRNHKKEMCEVRGALHTPDQADSYIYNIIVKCAHTQQADCNSWVVMESDNAHRQANSIASRMSAQIGTLILSLHKAKDQQILSERNKLLLS